MLPSDYEYNNYCVSEAAEMSTDNADWTSNYRVASLICPFLGHAFEIESLVDICLCYTSLVSYKPC